MSASSFGERVGPRAPRPVRVSGGMTQWLHLDFVVMHSSQEGGLMIRYLFDGKVEPASESDTAGPSDIYGEEQN